MQDQLDVYAYPYQDNLYINLTNRCTNNCEFCVRRGADGVGGYYLWIRKEPTPEEVIAQTGEDLDAYGEIVFCGFGEPMIRLEELKAVASYAKGKGKRVRVNTNGQANLIHDRDVTPELKNLVDCLSISLNSDDAEGYDNACHSQYGLDVYEGILDFSKRAMEYVPEVVLSVVDVIGEEAVERCKALCEERGIPLRVRSFIEPERP